jgi:hypothetical protein
MVKMAIGQKMAAAMALVQVVAGVVLNVLNTILILCQQTWIYIIFILVVTIMAFIVIPVLNARVIRYKYGEYKVVPNKPLGGIAQDGLMITLIVFFADFIPCVYISVIHTVDIVAISKATVLIAGAFFPVGFCIYNNVKHIGRQKKVLLEHPEEEELWEILRKCLVRQSKQTLFAMLPYVCIAALYGIVTRISGSKTMPEALRDIKNTYIDKDV